MDSFDIISTLTVTDDFSNDYVVLRYSAGSYSNGKFLTGTESALIMRLSVQPASNKERLLLKEGDRLKGSIKIFSQQELRTMNDINLTLADRVIFNNRKYEIKSVNNYIEHYEALGLLLNEDSI